MFRVRRYRLFLIFAALTVFIFYRFGSSAWESSTVDNIGQQLGIVHGPRPPPPPPGGPPPRDPLEQERLREGVELGTAYNSDWEHDEAFQDPKEKIPPPPLKEEIPRPEPQIYPGPDDIRKEGTEGLDSKISLDTDLVAEGGEARKEANPLPSEAPVIYWKKQKEHFPVSSTRQLPIGKATPLPKIQYDFSKRKENPVQKASRLDKLAQIKEAFQHAWKGYKKYAWMKDELTPISAQSKDTFMGWGATLVDSLDTMWMMGLKEDFEEAVEEVGRIDFKTSRRNDIPLFETVIRFLGGLIGAYDVSDQKYPILLEKAVELAEVLMGSMDTPNRMPIPYYQWKPTFASQPHRASSRLVLAELGSMAVEFTRLSQITEEPKYYDAIARITDALEEYQNRTSVPGLWPSYIDADGCSRELPKSRVQEPLGMSNVVSDLEPFDDSLLKEAAPMGFSASKAPSGDAGSQGGSRKYKEPLDASEGLMDLGATISSNKLRKRQAEDYAKAEFIPESSPSVPEAGKDFSHRLVESTTPAPVQAALPECEPFGLQSPSYGGDEYALGALADSTYEYFPKEYIMLSGLVPQYREMYDKFIDVATDKLLFRIMHPDEKRVLLAGGKLNLMRKYNINSEGSELVPELRPEGSHLTCFVGGMYALGAKLFERPQDLVIAKQLTDGCVWAYENTGTGIMPETFLATACDDKANCPWNQTQWYESLDPNREWREDGYKTQMKVYEKEKAVRASMVAERLARESAAAAQADEGRNGEAMAAIQTAAPISPAQADADRWQDKVKRVESFDDAGAFDYLSKQGDSSAENSADFVPSTTTENATPAYTKTSVVVDNLPPLYSPAKPPTHKEYVETRIKTEKLFPGLTSAPDKRYILRPEAIESMFYMWRITGEEYWREKGWNMVHAVLEATRVEYGASGIEDVFASKKPEKDPREILSDAFNGLKSAATKLDDEGEPIEEQEDAAPHLPPSQFAGAQKLGQIEKLDYSGPSPPTRKPPKKRSPELSPAPPPNVNPTFSTTTVVASEPEPEVDEDEDDPSAVIRYNDSMESFWLAETLKYAWMLFEDEDKWSLDEWVLNTEAHLLRRPDHPKERGTH